MIMEVSKDWSPEKAAAFGKTKINKKWEKLMWNY